MSEVYLVHHGIKGQKWGVRRFQNYDGTYTKKGLDRYNKARENYQNTKQLNEQGKASKGQVKTAKKKMNDAYKQLKLDKRADQGKELYKQGKTIGENNRISSAVTGISSLAILGAMKSEKLSAVDKKAIVAGSAVVSAVVNGKVLYENKKLRAYYAH